MKLKLSKIPVYYINLDKQISKRIDMDNRLSNVFKEYNRISAYDRDFINIENSFQYAPSDLSFKHAIAVAKSHIKALNSIDKLPALVLEDDAEFNDIPKSIHIPKDADIVYLGTNPMSVSDPENNFYSNFNSWKINWIDFDKNIGNKQCFRVYGMLGCHAMLYVSERSIELAKAIFLESANTGIPIDVLQHKIQKEYNCYVMALPVFVPKNISYGSIDLNLFKKPLYEPKIIYN